jgi:hypothetical protein
MREKRGESKEKNDQITKRRRCTRKTQKEGQNYQRRSRKEGRCEQEH